MKLFVTGGSGFIGRNLVEAFSGKYELFAPSHHELELLDEDSVTAYLEKHKVDVIVHSAVRPGHRNAKDPSDQLIKNTRMFFNLARNKHLYKKMIFLSSGCVYDQRFYQPKMKEVSFDSHVPVDEGGLSKYIIAKHIEKAEQITELRVFGVFGKYEDYAIRFISNMICKALFDLPLTMKQDRKFDYIYIDDLIAVIEYFIEHQGQHKAYNITPDSSIKLTEIAKMVLKISGKDLPITVASKEMGLEYSGDNLRLKQEINKLVVSPLEGSISSLYSWYADNKNSINKELLVVDR